MSHKTQPQAPDQNPAPNPPAQDPYIAQIMQIMDMFQVPETVAKAMLAAKTEAEARDKAAALAAAIKNGINAALAAGLPRPSVVRVVIPAEGDPVIAWSRKTTNGEAGNGGNGGGKGRKSIYDYNAIRAKFPTKPKHEQLLTALTDNADLFSSAEEHMRFRALDATAKANRVSGLLTRIW